MQPHEVHILKQGLECRSASLSQLASTCITAGDKNGVHDMGAGYPDPRVKWARVGGATLYCQKVKQNTIIIVRKPIFGIVPDRQVRK